METPTGIRAEDLTTRKLLLELHRTDSLASGNVLASIMVIRTERKTKMTVTKSGSNSGAFELEYITLKSVSAPEDQDGNRKRYCGVARADKLLELDWNENVRAYLGVDEEGKKRKSTLVNLAIRDTIDSRRDLFPVLNSGMVIVARRVAVEDGKKIAQLERASIINGAQTKGVIADYFRDHPDDRDYPSVNFELIVTDDEELVGDISISRNFQNKVAELSIYGRQGRFDELEKEMRTVDPKIQLRKSETHFGPEYLDTEKLVQVLTVLMPQDIDLPSIMRNKRTPETQYRVYAYRHRSRCLKDFAMVMDDPKNWSAAHKVFLDIAVDGWKLYERLKSEQFFSRLKNVKGDRANGQKVVAKDGVPDGIVFPMLSALGRFVRKVNGQWKIAIPRGFPWETLFRGAYIQETTTAAFNPQTMGKMADCYIALHGAIDMYFAVMESA